MPAKKEDTVEVPTNDAPEVASQRGGDSGPRVSKEVAEEANKSDEERVEDAQEERKEEQDDLAGLVRKHPLRAAAKKYHDAVVKQEKEAADERAKEEQDFDEKFPVEDAVASVQDPDPRNSTANNAQI